MELYFISFLFGYLFDHLQDYVGMYSRNKGVEYYAEVHQSFWNSIIHTIMMPITMFGMYIWIPALFRLNAAKAYKIRLLTLNFYFGLYCRISVYNAVMTGVWFYYTYSLSVKCYAQLKAVKDYQSVMYIGLLISAISLFIQEIIGHYIGGDDASRFEAIPNAILYAPYYAVSHILNLKNEL